MVFYFKKLSTFPTFKNATYPKKKKKHNTIFKLSKIEFLSVHRNKGGKKHD